MVTPKKRKAIRDLKIVQGAIGDSFTKLNPRKMMGNPVMFVVEVGSVLTTILLVRDTLRHAGNFGFGLQITLWLWFTVLFANFAEAMAEGRGKAQAETLRKARAETVKPTGCARRHDRNDLPAPSCVPATWCRYPPANSSPATAKFGRRRSVDESAITGESAPVIREAGGDRSAVTGGTRVLSDPIKVNITSNPGETFLDRMIRAGRGRVAAKDPERNRAQHPAGGPDDHLSAGRRHAAALRHLFRRAADVFSCWSRCWSA